MTSVYLVVGIILTIFIEIRTPWWRRHGGPISWKDFDDRIKKPAKRVTPPKIYRKIFNLPDGTVNIVTYINLTKNLVFILIAIVLLPFCFAVNAYEFEHIIYIFVSIFAIFWFPFSVYRIVILKSRVNRSLPNNRHKNTHSPSIHGSSASVHRLFEEHCGDFERMKDIVLQDKMPSTVFSKKGVVLNYSHLTRCKKYFTAEEYGFALDFFEKINPFYIDVEDGNVQFDFITRKGDPPMIVWSSLEKNSEAFCEFIGEDSDIEQLHNQWYMVIYK